MLTAQQITPQMEVFDSENRKLGAVAHVEDDRIGLSHDDFDGFHHFVPLSAVTKIDGKSITIEADHAAAFEAILQARRHDHPQAGAGFPLFGTSGHGTGDGGGGFGG
jgi:hypothetical protein